MIRTMIDAITHNQTSALESVRIDVEPKSVLHTSPLIFAVGGNRFINRYPSASAPVEIMPTIASP